MKNIFPSINTSWPSLWGTVSLMLKSVIHQILYLATRNQGFLFIQISAQSKLWKSRTFPNFRTISVYIDVNFICLWYNWGQNDLFKIRPAKTLLTQEKLGMHGRIFSTVATDALVLKHQAISIHSADLIFIVLDRFQTEISKLYGTIVKIVRFKKKIPNWFRFDLYCASQKYSRETRSLLTPLMACLPVWAALWQP